jgi:hypothetical protein
MKKKIKADISYKNKGATTSYFVYNPFVYSAPKGLIIWGVAKVIKKMKVMESEETARKWIKRQPKEEQAWYLPVPFIFGGKKSKRKTSKVKKSNPKYK